MKEDKEEKTQFNPKDIFRILIGIVGIVLGGQLVVNSATNIAEMFNVSDNVIALTIVAIGTSLPELVTTVSAAIKKESDIAIGIIQMQQSLLYTYLYYSLSYMLLV